MMQLSPKAFALGNSVYLGLHGNVQILRERSQNLLYHKMFTLYASFEKSIHITMQLRYLNFTNSLYFT